MAPNHILRHHPLITPRIEFKLAPRPPLPRLTPRMEFDPEHIAHPRPEEDGAPDPKRRRVSIRNPESGQTNNPGLESDEDRSSVFLPVPGPSTLIPKPAGEPGRPGSGGFNIEDTLIYEHAWSSKDVESLNKKVKIELKLLDVTVSFSRQDKKKIQEICDKMQRAWPQLAHYEDCWLVRSMLKLALKYRAESSRRARDKEAGERIRTALRGPSATDV